MTIKLQVMRAVQMTLEDALVNQVNGVAKDHVQTVAKARLGGVITTLGPRRMAETRAALLFALGW